MRVLITQVWLDLRGGSEAVVRDIAIGLLRRGHQPIIYSPRVGASGLEIRQKGIAVVDDLRAIAEEPDVIHGQHYVPTAEAIIHFPRIPVVNFCHAWEFWVERPVKFPQVKMYAAISTAVRDRLVHEEGIPPHQAVIFPNAIDLSRIPRRSRPLNKRPRRAACFSSAKSHVPLIQAVCKRNGIEFAAIGNCGDKPSASIEEELVNYDVVFATGRSALEAACCGCAVVVCDQRGCAEMLSMANLESYRNLNFALRLLAFPTTEERLQAALNQYDPQDAASVSIHLQNEANIDNYLDRLLQVYRDVISADRSAFEGQVFRNSLLSFLHATLPRTSSDSRWPWMEERALFEGEIRRLESELTTARESRVGTAPGVRHVLHDFLLAGRRWIRP